MRTPRRPTKQARPGGVLSLIVAAGMVLAACGDDADDGSAARSPVEPTATDEVGAPDAAGTPTVAVATDAEIGEYLVDGDGFTLYLFALDDGTTTACIEECIDVWPPVVAAEPVAGDGIDAGALSTATGIEPDHVTYHGHLLYLYVGDPEPGAINGTDIAEWYAIDPSGAAIGAPSTGSAGVTSPDTSEPGDASSGGY